MNNVQENVLFFSALSSLTWALYKYKHDPPSPIITPPLTQDTVHSTTA